MFLKKENMNWNEFYKQVIDKGKFRQ